MKLDSVIKIATTNNLPLLLVGKHGTGKSYSIAQAAQKAGKTLHRLIITQETTPEDLVCQYELKDNETQMLKRALLIAAEQGDWIVFEEINMGSPAVLTLLNGLLETDPESRYVRFQNMEVKPHKEFRMFATSNPTSYSGANRMNDALLSRFLVQLVQPDYLGFLGIIKDKFDDQKIYDAAKKFLSAAQKVEKNYELYISPRELLVYAGLRADKISHKDAIQLILGRHYDLEDDVLSDIAALFDTEMERDNVFIINEVELKKKIDSAIEDVNSKLSQLQNELETAKAYKEKYEKARTAFGE